MRILLKGFYGFGNFGDDLLMLVFYRYIKQNFSSAKLYLFSNATENNIDFAMPEDYNHYIAEMLDEEVRVIDWTYQGHFEIVIDGGGGVFFDYSKADRVTATLNRMVSIFSPQTVYRIEKVLRILLRRKENITFDRRYAIGVNIGPFGTISKQFMRLYSQIGSIDGFLVRDRESLNFLERFSHRGNVSLIDDAVFSDTMLPELKRVIGTESPKLIGFVITDWMEQGADYLQNITAAAKQLELEGFRCMFFAFCEADDAGIMEHFAYPVNYWLPNSMTLAGYLDKLAHVDIMVSMRFHGLVVATAMGIPSVGLGINPKIRDFSIQAEICSKLVDLPLHAEDIQASVEEIVADYAQLRKNALKRTAESAERTVSLISHFIGDIAARSGAETC